VWRYGARMAHSALVGPFPAGANPDEYDQLRRRVFWMMPSGIYLVGSRAGQERNLMTTSWVTQVAREPKLLGISVEREARTHDLIERGRAFSVAFVARADKALVRKFVRPATENADGTELNGVSFHDAHHTGVPVPDAAIGYFECRLERAVEFGSHTLFVGEVVDVWRAEEGAAEVLRMEDTRMNYGG
jgi:flavin reductase (DIM6/NTAB) family NADH-FMN oxidoreductase RutF